MPALIALPWIRIGRYGAPTEHTCASARGGTRCDRCFKEIPALQTLATRHIQRNPR